MATHTLLKTGSGRGMDTQEIRELRELFADAPELGKKTLENVLRELTLQLCVSGLLLEGGTRVETHSDHHYSERRYERLVASACGPPRGTLAQVAQRHSAAASPIPFRSRQFFTKPDVVPIVFVAADDVAVHESLEPMIRSEGWHPELFVSAQELLSRPRPTVPGCLILDVNLPGLNGLELRRQLADRYDMPIVFISDYADAPLSVQAMKAGGVEFLTKPLQDDVLLRVIRDAIERSREARRLDLELQALRGCYYSLTQREREVMALVVAGLLNKQVGGKLGIQEITVKIHRSQVMRKMKAESLPDLVVMAARLGLRPAGKH